MEKQVLLNIAIKKEADGFSVICTDLDVASQGETIEEATANIKEAIELYLESAEEIGITDEVLDKIGLVRGEHLEKEFQIPRVFRTEIPIKLAL